MPGTKTRDTALRERFKPLYVASFLQGFVFWFAIEKLFMTSIGLNSRTISIIVIVFATITLTMNVPMGVIADRWSRKGILMFASCCMIASCTIAGLSNGFWMYLVAACFFGLFQAGSQGVYDSLAYDVLMEDTGSANDYEYYRGRMQLYGGVALVLGGLMSAVITHYLNFRATYFLTIPFMLGSLAVLCYFREPREHKKEVSQLLGAHIHSTLNSILRKREVFWIVATLVLASVAAKMLLDFDQLW
jgi:MFS family permease